MTEQERTDWHARLEAAVADTIRRRQARRQMRDDHAAARAAGLVHRNRARLARARGETMPNADDHAEQPPCCRDSGHPDGCPQHVQALAVLDPRRGRRASRRRINPSPAAPGPDGPEAA